MSHTFEKGNEKSKEKRKRLARKKIGKEIRSAGLLKQGQKIGCFARNGKPNEEEGGGRGTWNFGEKEILQARNAIGLGLTTKKKIAGW